MHGVIVGHVKAKYNGMGNMKFSIGIYRFFYLLFYGYKYRPNSLNSVSAVMWLRLLLGRLGPKALLYGFQNSKSRDYCLIHKLICWLRISC